MGREWIRLALLTVFFLSVCHTSASALNVIEKEDFYIYYPDEAAALAVRLSLQTPEMVTFLEGMSLPVSFPIHVVLDNELDHPEVKIALYPHREVRLPLRAPGVLEDGFTEPDPWRYFLFKGLCIQGIYSERSGLPGGLYWVFGEIISPNLILPDWILDGISNLLYEQYVKRPVYEPMANAIFSAMPVPNLDRVSNHPEIWPGRYSYRIFGRPFVRWLNDNYGWERLLDFIQRHGRGIIPLEIDIKAKLAFGLSWNQIWRYFQAEHIPRAYNNRGSSISGYWGNPFLYWNDAGIYPGMLMGGRRGRYGFVDNQDWLWLSQYVDGTAQVKLQSNGTIRSLTIDHVWDPGPGAVAVTRKGTRPYLVVFEERKKATLFGDHYETVPVKQKIEVPADVIQLSGPVMDEKGRIAVAGNRNGNWDIWLYDGAWHRITDAPSVEMDPWLADDKLIFSSNSSGAFQIQGVDMHPLTKALVAATLPREHAFLDLGNTGWHLDKLASDRIPPLPEELPTAYQAGWQQDGSEADGKPYSAFKSVWPNQIMPDIFFNTEEFQLGLSTQAYDVSKVYSWDAGIRYDTDESQFTGRLGWQSSQWSTRAVKYPFGYHAERSLVVDEIRSEVEVAWSPPKLKALSLGANWRRYDSSLDDRLPEDEWWANLTWEDPLGHLQFSAHLDIFDDDSQSLYGDMLYWIGQPVNLLFRLEAGKTWGEANYGHNTFRIGGYSTEGDFTKRTTRLFPLRGFESNTLDARQAAVFGIEMVLPFAKLQTGYKTLPLFLHNMSLGTFVDAGFAADDYRSDELLIGAGFELITGMELAWGSMSDFRIGIAWPLRHPDDIEDKGPVVLIQIGKPL